MSQRLSVGQPAARIDSLPAAPGLDRWLPPVGIEKAFALGVLLLGLVAWASLTLAGFSAFTRGALMAVVLPGAVIGAWAVIRARTTRSRVGRPVATRHVLVLGACLIATLFATGRPGEYLIGGVDASVYLNLSSLIEQRGGIKVSDPTLDLLDEQARETFFSRDTLWPHLLNLFPGGIQVSEDGRLLQPNFFHLLPAVMAGVAVLTGWPGAGVFVLTISGSLTLVGVWLLTLRLASPPAASVAVLLLTSNYAQIWYLGYSSSEALTAALVVSGLALLLRSSQDGSRSAGALGGAAVGLAACARIDAFVLVSSLVAMYLCSIAWRRRWTTATTWTACLFVAITAHAALHASLVSAPYTQRILLRAFDTGWVLTPETLILLAAASFGGVTSWRVLRRWPDLRRAPIVRAVLAIVLLGLFVRSWPEFASGSAALLFTPVGLTLMAFGVVWLVFDRPEPDTVLVVSIFTISAVVYIGAPLAGRLSPTVWRRLVPIVIPLSGLFVGYAIARLWDRASWWRIAAPLLAGALVLLSAWNTRMLFAVTPMTDVRARLARVVASVPPGTVLVTDDSLPSHMALSLHITIGQPVLSIRRAPETAAELERLARTLGASGRTLRLATTPAPEGLGLRRDDFSAFDLLPAGAETLEWTEVQRVRGAVPTQFRNVEARIEFYDLRLREASPLPLVIDIGADDFGWRGDGFHGPERMGDAMVRWTTGEALVDVPRLVTSPPARLVLRLAAPRPAGRPPVPLHVILDGRLLPSSSELVFPDFREVAIELDSAAVSRLAARPSRLAIRTESFVPREDGLGDDARRLGVMVDWMRIEAR